MKLIDLRPKRVGADMRGVCQLGALLNQIPVIPDGTPTSTYDVTDTAFKVISSVSTNSSTVVTLEYGTASGVYTNTVTAAESPISATGDVNFSLTGLNVYTNYYFRIKAENSAGIAYSNEFVQRTIFNATLTATGTGAGVSTLRLEVSENQTLTITSGNARFYTDAAGTLGESTTWAVTTGALRTIYLIAPSGSSVLNIQKPDKVINIGNSANVGWGSGSNAAIITLNVSYFNISTLRIEGRATITGILPSTLTYLRFWLEAITWSYTSALPDLLTHISIDSASCNWTGLSVGNTGNITTLVLVNYRTTKMSSLDMVTLLTQLTNRTGSLPNTITINDYADFAAPPQSVTDAVAALKVAKPNVTTVNLGA